MLTTAPATPHGQRAFPRRKRPTRSVLLGVTVAALTAVLVGLAPGPALAQDDDIDEGGNESLRDKLDEAGGEYHDAKAELEESEKRELKLVVELETLEEDRRDLVEDVQILAATSYRSGRVGPVAALLNSSSPNDFLDRAVGIEIITQRENDQLAELIDLTESAEEQQAKIAEEIAIQEEEVEKLEQAKKKAEDALFAIGGGDSGEFEAFPAEDAAPAPRNGNGAFDSESCSESDPTTSGCLTPRMLHAYNEMQLFGFNRHTSCYRSTDFGEHGLGRACDMSASAGGFGGVAVGDDKEYGDRLASFLVHNSDAFGVQYVIWYQRIWFPGNGWRTYSGTCGNPSCDHTNHVHLSVV